MTMSYPTGCASALTSIFCFQAEDGIRDRYVTGVQTCALPISRLQEGSNTVTLRRLAEARDPGWGGKAMRLDRLPSEYNGGGVKIALIDSGVATSHPQLDHIDRGFATRDGAAWSEDAAGHGTPCAGVIAAAANGDNAV